MARPRPSGPGFFPRRLPRRASHARRLGYEPLESRLVLSTTQVRFEFTDTGGEVLDELHVGQDFNLNVHVRDTRDDPAGIFQAFLDVDYGAGLISTTGPVSPGFFYGTAAAGSVAVPGLIDDAGGIDTDGRAPEPPGMELLLFSVPFQANALGQLELSPALTQLPTRQFVFFDSVSATPFEDIDFVGGSIEITEVPAPEVSIAATQNGNEAGAAPGVFTVTQSVATGSNTVIQYTVAGTATAGSDYTPLSGTVTILAGQTTATINVPVINDALVEAAESVIVALDDITGGDPTVVIDSNADDALLFILDNDSAQVSIAATTGGDESGPVDGQFTVTQSAISSTDTVISLKIGGTATEGSDYASIATSVTISAGSTTATIDVPVIDDSQLELAETVLVTLTEITDGDPEISLQSAGTEATLSIADNEAALVRVAKTEDGDESGPADGVFTITQTAVSPTDTIITYSISGDATADSDYKVPTGTATISAGETTTTITVPVLDDPLIEPDETVVVTLDAITDSHPQVSIDPNGQEATMTIADDDSALVRIEKTADGNESGPAGGIFTVTQTAESSTDTVVSYTVGGTATAGEDYAALSGTVTIPAGETSAVIDVAVIDDDDSEGVETVIVTLQSITDGDEQIQIDSGQDDATVEIADDEIPLVRIAATSDADEDGPVNGVFTVSQTLVAAANTVVSYTVGGSAMAGEDYTALSGTATILAGATSTTIDVSILDDFLIEGLETVIVTLEEITSGDENLQVDAANDQATVEVSDDESGLVSIEATENGAEDGPSNGVFTVAQDGIAAVDTIVTYTISGSATAGDDYAPPGGTVTIAAGQTSATISLSVLDDSLVEPDETVIVTLDEITDGSSLVALDPSRQSATLEIADNDTAEVRIDSAVDGSESGPADGMITIVQTAASSTDTVIQYSIGGTADAGDDYTALSGTATISAGEISTTIDVSVIDDNIVEAIETVTIMLTALDTSGAQVTIDQQNDFVAVEITDDDTAQVSVAKMSDGNETGPADVVFVVSLTAPSSTATEIQYNLGGTATAGDDYTAPSGIVTIAAGSTSQEINIPVIDDAVLDGIETITISLDSISDGDPQITINLNEDTAAADLLDNETGLVSIAVTTAGNEAGPAAGVFTVSQSGTTDVDTVVMYSIGGTATADEDYTALSGTVTIAAGQSSATIDVPVLEDQRIEGDETVIVTLQMITAGDDRLDIDPAGDEATMTIDDDDTGLVSIAPDAGASEDGPTSGSFVVTQSGIANVATVVSFTVSGTASSGSDFVPLTLTVTIPEGETTATIDVDAIDDAVVEATETVIVTLVEVTSGSQLVAVDPNNDTASIELSDNDSAEVSIAATDDGDETGSVAGVFTVTQSAVSSTDTVISYTVGGTAASGSDFTALSGTVTISAGDTTATIDVPVIDDAAVEGIETISVTLNEISEGDEDITIDSAADAAALEIQDNDTATIAFADGASSVIEVVGSHTVVVRLSIADGGTLGQAVSVNVATAGGTASAADFTLQTTSVTFAAGSADGDEQIVNLAIADDGVLEPAETVILDVAIDSDGTGGRASIGSPGTHTVTIIDDPSTGTISGFVWADTNGNGSRDGNEIGIPGVTVRLTGVDNFGASVELATTTGDNGEYSFSELAGGTYDIIQLHPFAFNDGGESLGTVAGSPSGQVGDDRFTGVELGATEQGIDYNFGEWGVKSQFVNVRFFLASTPANVSLVRDVVVAGQNNAQTQVAATPVPSVAAAVEQESSLETQTAPAAPPQQVAEPAASPFVASSLAATALPPPAPTIPPPVPSTSEPTAVDVRIVDFLASTQAARADAEAEMSALAFAAELSHEADAGEGPSLASPASVAANNETPPTAPSSAAMLLEDDALERNIAETLEDDETADERLTDQALVGEESWLDALVA